MLSVSGTVSFESKEQGGVIVTCYLNDKKQLQVLSKRNGRFDFKLNYNKQYIIEVSKAGFVTKRLILDTQIPNEVLKTGGVIEGFYDLNIPLIKDYPGLDKSYFSKPVTRFYFSQSDWLFIKDEVFYNQVAKRLEPVVNQLTKLKNNAVRAEKIKADSLLLLNKEEEAYIALQRALAYDPGNKEIQQQSKKLEKSLKQQKNIDARVKDYLDNGDAFLESNNLYAALHQYEKANAIKPNNALIANKIYQLDSINSYINFQYRQKYDSLINLGDISVAQKNYAIGIDYYFKAWEIFPEEDLPHEKIENAEAAKKMAAYAKNEKEQQKIELAIEGYKKKGDTYLANNNLSEAKKLFEEANKKFPDESFFKIQLKKIKTQEENELKHAQELKQEELNNKIEILIIKGDSLFKLSLWVEAKECYLKAEELNPGNKNLLSKIEKTTENLIRTQTYSDRNLYAPDTSLLLSAADREIQIKQFKTQLEKEKSLGNEEQMGELYGKIASSYHLNNNLSNALLYYEEALTIKKNYNDQEGATNILNDIASVYYDSGSYDNAIEKYFQAIEIQKVVGNKEVEAMMLDNIGQVYENMYNYDKAVTYYQQSLNIADNINNEDQQSSLLSKIADVYTEQNNLELAADNLEEKLKIDIKRNKQDEISSTLNSLGSAFYGLKKYDEALDYYKQSLKTTSSAGDKKQMSIALNNIGNVNYDKGNYREAIDYYSRSIELKREIDYNRGLAISLHNLGNSFQKLSETANAIKFFDQSLELANKMKYQDIASKNYSALAKLYSEIGNFQKAYENQLLFEETREDLTASIAQISESAKDLNWEGQSKMITTLKGQLVKQRLLSQYHAEQKQKQIEIKNLELQNQAGQIKRQRILNLMGIAGSSALAIILLLIYRQFLIKKRNNEQLKTRNELISFQKQQITDSIEYAGRIQRAVLPPDEYMLQILPDHFILNKPRDIVSGDYYWTTQRSNESIIAVADCTGHGVPGAFMSMLGISFLNEIVNKKSSSSSHEILNELRQYVIKSLHQTHERNNVLDGMDIALCIIDTDKMKLQYSGAQNPLFLIRNNELIEYKADKMPIGIGFFNFENKSFTTNEIQIEKGDMIYIFSDGYADQFGGLHRKKYGIRKFKEFLTEINQLPTRVQMQSLDISIVEWQGQLGQVDDILIIGVRI